MEEDSSSDTQNPTPRRDSPPTTPIKTEANITSTAACCHNGVKWYRSGSAAYANKMIDMDSIDQKTMPKVSPHESLSCLLPKTLRRRFFDSSRLDCLTKCSCFA